jgi:hypothetical protein
MVFIVRKPGTKFCDVGKKPSFAKEAASRRGDRKRHCEALLRAVACLQDFCTPSILRLPQSLIAPSQ